MLLFINIHACHLAITANTTKYITQLNIINLHNYIMNDADLDIWSIGALSIEWFPDLDVINHGLVRVHARQVSNLPLVPVNFVGHCWSLILVFVLIFSKPWNEGRSNELDSCFASALQEFFFKYTKCYIPYLKICFVHFLVMFAWYLCILTSVEQQQYI